MSELKILDVYNKTNDNRIDAFKNKTNSNLQISTSYDKIDANYEWLDMMEDTIRYLDNILRNPNRFIVNEEDIVKIELARRVTVESIKHLARNTNLIQDYDKETGDVKPSKILNINKEESYNTYENRFIYSLIQNMKYFIARKKSQGIIDSSLKDNKTFNYTASSKLGVENVDISVQLDSKIDTKKRTKDELGLGIDERIEKLELQIADLTNSEVYRTLDRLHIALVTSPIKKTNVILKNVNFQYAVKLWNYMQENIDDSTRRVKNSKNYQDDGEFKQYLDETFLLNYLVLNSLNSEEEQPIEKKELSEKIVGNMIGQVMALNNNISEDEIKDIVSKQYAIVKYRYVTSDKSLYKIFNKSISKYLDIFNNLKI